MTKFKTIDTAALSNVSGGAASQWSNWASNASTGWNAPQQWGSQAATKWAAPAATGAWAGAKAWSAR